MAEQKEFRWSAPEFEYFHKGVSWYWLIIIAAVVLVALSLLQKNFLFSVFIVISAALILRLGYKRPRYLDFHLNDKGLLIDEKNFYSYDDLVGFATRSLYLDDGLSEVILKRKHRLGTYLKILLPNKHLEEIRVFLNKYLPEIEYEESLTDHLSKLLKF